MSKEIHLLKATPKVWNYIKYRFLKRKALMSVRRYTPQIASLFLTMRCNLNCGYCNSAKIFREGKVNWRESEATLGKVKSIFANPLFANCIFVDLSGGEPLLVQDLDHIVAYLAKRGHTTNVITNGLLLNERIVELKRAGVSRISISLYDENLSAMKNELEEINKVFPVHTSIVLLRSAIEKNSDKILDMARFAYKSGCLSLRFFMYRPLGVDPDIKEIITDTYPAYIEFRHMMEDALPEFCVWPAVIKTKTVKKLCPQLWQRISCDMLGNMLICCGTDMMLQGKNSNLFHSEPDILFNHSTLLDMRKQLLSPGCEPPDICKTCNLLGDPGW